MLFNSIEFAVFLPIVFVLYWFATDKNLKAQNILLLVASYFFYGWWDWRFLLLLVIVSISNYILGILIDKNDVINKRKHWLILGIIINLGILGVFKYYNFFVDSFIELISLAGYNLPKSSARIILPLGISFYMFLSLSYIIDIYKKTFNANMNIVQVLLSLGFFPIILAGPIQRPSLLLPQIAKKREFYYDQATDGLKQILWGLFVKIIIADKLASYVDDIFLNYSKYSGSTLLLGAAFYSVQIYADFSGYSNIAIGIGKLFGFRFMRNFAYPYFSRDITEFWKRWHISLTTWFRDYIFLPLSVSVSSKIRSEKVFYLKSDLFLYLVAGTITWFLTGLWHGANYTFIIWGMIHGIFLIIYRWQMKPRKRMLKLLGITNENIIIVIIETIITLTIVLIAWVFFRAQTVSQALVYVAGIFSNSIFSIPEIFPIKILALIFLFFTSEWLQREKEHALQPGSPSLPRMIRWGFYIGLIFVIVIFGGGQQKFIYFQF